MVQIGFDLPDMHLLLTRSGQYNSKFQKSSRRRIGGWYRCVGIQCVHLQRVNRTHLKYFSHLVYQEMTSAHSSLKQERGHSFLWHYSSSSVNKTPCIISYPRFLLEEFLAACQYTQPRILNNSKSAAGTGANHAS